MQLDLQGQKLLKNSSCLERERWEIHINASTSLYRPNLSDKLITSNEIHKIKTNSLETWKHWICWLLDCFQIISKHIRPWYTLTNIVFPNCNKRTHTNISWGSYCICPKLSDKVKDLLDKIQNGQPLMKFRFQLVSKKQQGPIKTKPGTASKRMYAGWTLFVQVHWELQLAKEKVELLPETET